jgi:hypothetical protein
MKTLIKAIDSIFPEKYDPKKDSQTIWAFCEFVSLLFDTYFIGKNKERLLKKALVQFENGGGAKGALKKFIDDEAAINEA